MHAGGQKLLAETCQRRRFRAAKHVWRDREVELIDQTLFQQRAKKRWPAFACKPSDVVFAAQDFQHREKIDAPGVAHMEGRLLPQSFLFFPRHSLRRKDEDRRNVGLKNLQPIVNSAFVGNDHTQWASALTALAPCFLQFSWQPEPNVVALHTGVPDQNRVSQSALAKQMQLVFT